jgi:hypothetical protein
MNMLTCLLPCLMWKEVAPFNCLAFFTLSGKRVGQTIQLRTESEFKRRIARKERFPGSQRRIGNQHRTNAVSRFTLGVILKRRYEINEIIYLVNGFSITAEVTP